MSENHAESDRPAWQSYKWPAIVIGLLAGHVFIITGALVLSSTFIPAATVAPAGYAEALAWDELKAARAASERLGWSLVVTPASDADVRGDRRVDFELVDRDGQPIEGAELFVTMYHHSRPGAVIEKTIPPDDDGPGYHANLPMRREGQWRLSALAQHGGKTFVVESDLWLATPGEGAAL